ncbi:MAG: peptidoglycan DD-metalloendopeptidase family protein [Anaerolineae bacterium]|nr:peptidoglycan DD-metalloendopeptidase family protein [Anaerolineae bacterium]
MAHTVFIRGIPDNPSVIDVRVRLTPGVDGVVLFRSLINTPATADEIVLDPQSASIQGQVYRWFHLTFADKRSGWVRDDLLDIQGDLTEFGYSNYPRRTFAFVAAQSVPANQIKKPASAAAPVPSQPVQPVVPPTPKKQTQPVPVEPVQTPICKGNARPDVQPNLRAGPSITATPVGRIQPNDPVSIYGVEMSRDGDLFRWVKVEYKGLLGYVREDLLTYQDECNVLGLPKPVVGAPKPVTIPPITLNSAKFDSPVAGYIITQEFGVNNHRGTDFGLRVGSTVSASGNGTAFTLRCQRCRSDAPNFRSQNVSDNDRGALNDPAWGYGFGNLVIVRYAWESLPDAMRSVMTQRGLSNGFVYAIHAHLSDISVANNQLVSKGTVIGLSGNTGNSTGAHLHLELRLSMDGSINKIEGLFQRAVENSRSMYNI